jgi:hypothetical protein
LLIAKIHCNLSEYLPGSQTYEKFSPLEFFVTG